MGLLNIHIISTLSLAYLFGNVGLSVTKNTIIILTEHSIITNHMNAVILETIILC